MTLFLHNLLDLWIGIALWMIGFFATFSVLARWMPCNPKQALWRKSAFTDMLYFFIMPVLNRFVHIIMFGLLIFVCFHNISQETLHEYIVHGFGPLSRMPLWLQAAIIFFLQDVMLYWTHRWFHGRAMWRFHAIHHSPLEVDWLSTYRFHPVNTWLSFSLVDVLILGMGFSPEGIGIMAGVNMIYSAMVHANLNWTFGPLKYIFASPVFHRWHHTSQEEGLDKNFAPTFPLLDILFGTFYMPEDKLPEHFGVRGYYQIPEHFLGQMTWPFKQKKE